MVMSNDIAVADSDAVVIVVGEADEMYPNAPITDIILSAADGKIKIFGFSSSRTSKRAYGNRRSIGSS